MSHLKSYSRASYRTDKVAEVAFNTIGVVGMAAIFTSQHIAGYALRLLVSEPLMWLGFKHAALAVFSFHLW
ncbi:MAG: hypothetical protein F8N36_13935 [Desulfovibrio sp.]|uniref:hypothetical protein n=1 Tax=Desulfovibrio sp. TaxID=885 RepID=UPI00135DFEDA|nr:hypothetical protein [Desulfovibrio sp.]MTJ93939.1 hypothetical protein [Desulfovibrio sp.]